MATGELHGAGCYRSRQGRLAGLVIRFLRTTAVRVRPGIGAQGRKTQNALQGSGIDWDEERRRHAPRGAGLQLEYEPDH